MPRITDPDTEHAVLINYQPGMEWKPLSKLLKKKNVFVSDKTCKAIVEREGKRRQAKAESKKYEEYHKPSKITKKVLNLVNKRTSVPNPLPQKSIALQAGISQSKVHQIIYNDLDKQKKMKTTTLEP